MHHDAAVTRIGRPATLLAAIGLILGLLAAGTGVAWGGSAEVKLRAELEGDKIDGVEPRGEARFREVADDGKLEREFRTKVQDVNLPGGTELTVAVEGAAVGTIVLEDNNDGELRLRSEDGDEVPSMSKGDEVTVAADGVVILSGVFVDD